MNGVRHYLLALQFFTRVPVTGRLAEWIGFSPQMLRASAAHFPGVGWLVGGVGAAVFVLALQGLPGVAGALAAALLSMAATVLLTGAFHEDGLADVADGLGGSADRGRALEIMKDSRIGAYGAVGLVLMLGLKAAALASLPMLSAMAALLFAHTASRAATVAVMGALPYAGDAEHAKAKPIAHQARAVEVAIACGSAVLLAVLLPCLPGPWSVAWPTLAAALIAAALMAVCCARWLKHRLGGITGDTLGATQQLVEVAMLLAWLGSIRWS